MTDKRSIETNPTLFWIILLGIYEQKNPSFNSLFMFEMNTK